jgi:hypothetical protein
MPNTSEALDPAAGLKPTPQLIRRAVDVQDRLDCRIAIRAADALERARCDVLLFDGAVGDRNRSISWVAQRRKTVREVA